MSTSVRGLRASGAEPVEARPSMSGANSRSFTGSATDRLFLLQHEQIIQFSLPYDLIAEGKMLAQSPVSQWAKLIEKLQCLHVHFAKALLTSLVEHAGKN